MVINLTASMCFIIVMLILVIDFNLKEKIQNIDNICFKYLSFFSIIGLLLQFVTYFLALNGFDKNSIILLILGRTIFLYYVVFMYFFIMYIFATCFVLKENDKTFKKFVIIETVIYFLFAILTLILPFSYSNSETYLYPVGLATDFSYLIGGLGIFFGGLLSIIKIKTLKSKKALPIFVAIVLAIISISIQMNFHDLLLLIPSHAIVILIMYFTIENPDVKMLREITLAKDLAEKANRAKSDFLSSMSHEIRTPLNAIVGLSEDIASYKDRVPKAVVEDTEDILNASQTLLEIVGNILDINKIESEKMEIVEVPYDFRKEITSLSKVTSSRIGEKSIEFKLDIAEDIPHELIGDRVHVKGIVNNLLSNAIKYTEKGKVELSARCINNGDTCNLIISVKDTGRGIKAEYINKLFTKFERLDVERNSTTEGTGLGLAITKSLVDMMGGKINVQSSFGQGSIFIVQIPQKISKMVKEEVHKDEVIKFEMNYGHKKILIVDDNLLNVKVAKKALADFDFEIDVCENGEECLNKIKAGNSYDLILMDIMMPVMSGETALKNLKEIPGFNTPVIALTADAVAGAYEKYKAQGFVDYIAKPFNKEQISEKLDVIFYKLESDERWRDVPKYVIE